MPRRRASGGRSRRMAADWVYRGQEYNVETGAVVSPFGASYDEREVTVTAGPGTPAGLVLVDSPNYRAALTQFNVAAGAYYAIDDAARPYRPSLTVRRVQGHLLVRPSAWAVGNNLRMLWRIIVGKQNPSSGAVILPAEYSEWGGAVSPNNSKARWANSQGNAGQGYLHQAFENTNDRWIVRINVPMRRRLFADQALFLYIEARAGASDINPIIEPRVRSLVEFGKDR